MSDPQPRKFLGVAISAESIKMEWIRSTVWTAIIKKNSNLTEVFLLIFDEIDPAGISQLPYYKSSRPILLTPTNFVEGSDQLLEAILPSIQARKRRVEGSPEPIPFVVSGIFEFRRPATTIFQDLRQQVNEGKDIDQKFLYWDLAAAMRWADIASVDYSYQTPWRSSNLIATKGVEIIRTIDRESRSNSYTFINLGVGTGTKDFNILNFLLGLKKRISYIAVDESFPMIQITMGLCSI